MSLEQFQILNVLAVAFLVWNIPLQFIPVMIWLERKGAAIIQDRIGPNRAEIMGVRLFGMLHNIADVIKLMMKEDVIPSHVNRFYYLLAPFWSMTIALCPLMLVPIAAPIVIGEYPVRFQVAEYDTGLLMLLAITGLGVYGVILAGWSSNNKFSLLGGLRSSAQMISYELSMGLAVVAALMIYRDLRVDHIVELQGGLLVLFDYEFPLPNWGVFFQPVGFLLFLTAAFAETNRTPFDLAEGESELVAGYHTEYSSMKFALFFMAEYANMVVASVVTASLFLGGYQVPFVSTEVLRAHPEWTLCGMLIAQGLGLLVVSVIVQRRAATQKRLYKSGVRALEYPAIAAGALGAGVLSLVAAPLVVGLEFGDTARQVIPALAQVGMLLGKTLALCWLFIHVRWTLPRFRYDQLMSLGWKLMIPVALLNILLTGLARML